MTGAIPSYGAHFRHECTEYDPVYGSRKYVLKTDSAWYLRSDKTSKRWWIFKHSQRVSPALPSMTIAMDKLLFGIKEGFYQSASHA